MLLILVVSILIFHGVTLFLGAPSYLINLHVASQLPQCFLINNETMSLTFLFLTLAFSVVTYSDSYRVYLWKFPPSKKN